jgi:predicted lipoprotein with Yx(FWY)xxD motif
MRHIRMAVLAGTAVLGLALTACGGSPGTDRAGTGQSPGATATTKLAAAEIDTLGTIVTDSQGRTLYRFDDDTARPSVSNCAGDCAVKWPPALVGKGQTVRLAGVNQALVGTVKRADGSMQLTLAGWPLYQFAKDTLPGDTLGQGVGGVWFAATPEGTRARPVEPQAEQPSDQQDEQPDEQPADDGSGDGYGY